ncbi:MAG: hypothetical protein PUB86_03635 [Elusimicrobia bacterium]|nr:hypothetical protein [Elusimicrobiota bacterium]
MKYKNITAFLLGVFVAALLWQYYLKPKYLIKSGDEETLYAIHQADIAALNEATAEIDGEVLFKDYGESAEFKNDIINNSTGEDEEFEFHSTANREPDFFEQASRPEPKESKIIIDNEDPVMHPDAISKGQPVEEFDSADLPNRITMISAPVKFTEISSDKDYKAYKKANPADYPSVNFKKDRIIFVESDSALSNGFFEIKDYTANDNDVTVNYRVNILGAAKRPEEAPYIIIPLGKPVVLKQVK